MVLMIRLIIGIIRLIKRLVMTLIIIGAVGVEQDHGSSR